MPSRVLIIDDDVSIATALAVRLRAMAYEVSHAPGGLRGIEMVAEVRPDVILLDIRMPDIDGIEVCRRLKSEPDLAAIPVIFVSANLQDEARSKSEAAGGAAHIGKPFESSEVLETIERVLADASAPTRLTLSRDGAP